MKVIALLISLMSLGTSALNCMNESKIVATTLPTDILFSEVYPQIAATEDFFVAFRLARFFSLTDKRFQNKSLSLLKDFITTRTSIRQEHLIGVALKIYKMIQHGTTNTFLKKVRNYLKNPSNQDVFKLLLENIENYTKNKEDHPELNRAIAQRDFARIELIYDRINVQLLQAAYAGDREKLEALLKDPYTDCNAQCKYGRTSLMLAIENNQLSSATVLLAAPINLNMRDNNGSTALIYAACKNMTPMVIKLIELGVKVNTSENDGCTALMAASGRGYSTIAQILIDAGADVNAKDRTGMTALIWAVRKNRTQLVKILLQANANVDALEKKIDSQKRLYFTTALVKAVWQRNEEIVKLLIDAQADVNTGHTDGITPLYHATEIMDKKMVELLLEAGADANARNYYGETPLMAALGAHWDYSILKIVLDNVLRQDKNLDRILVDIAHKAFEYPAAAFWVIQKLVKAGADVNAQDHNGKTALSYVAHKEGLEKIADFLRQSGAQHHEDSCSVQ